jgi:hypothetical protein
MHGAGVSQAAGGPAGSVEIGPDGSFAALVPARRALSWQLTDGNGAGVVRERNWISFQAGEIRVCANCHGVNTLSQTHEPAPTNEPEALHDLLAQWKQQIGATPGAATATPVPTRTATPNPVATPTSPIGVTPTGTATPGPGVTPTPTVDPGDEACRSGIAIEKARLRTSASSRSIRVSGRATVPQPWVGVAPDTNGVRIAIDGVLDVTVPGGAGWTVGSKGKRWRFDDPAGVLAGIRRVEVADRSAQKPGRLTFEVRILGAPLLPVAGPIDLSIRLGTDDECASVHWNGSGGGRPRCQGEARRLRCS